MGRLVRTALPRSLLTYKPTLLAALREWLERAPHKTDSNQVFTSFPRALAQGPTRVQAGGNSTLYLGVFDLVIKGRRFDER